MQRYLHYIVHVLLGLVAVPAAPLIRVAMTLIHAVHAEGIRLASDIGDIHKTIRS